MTWIKEFSSQEKYLSEKMDGLTKKDFDQIADLFKILVKWDLERGCPRIR
jgi:hypothetical protein